MRELVQDIGGVKGYRFERRSQLVVPLLAGKPRKVLLTQHFEYAVSLVQRVVGAERVLEHALDVAVVLVQLSLLQAYDVTCPRK